MEGEPQAVRRLLREDNLLCLRRRKFRIATTDSSHTRRVYPNLAGEIMVTQINQLWVADITYIRLETEFVDRTLEDNLRRRALCKWRWPGAWVPPGLVHHSDRGVQYASSAHIALLEEHGIAISMSPKRQPLVKTPPASRL